MIRNYLLMFAMFLAIGVASGCQGAPQQQVLSPVYSGEIASFDESVSPVESVNLGGGGSPGSSSGHGQNHSH